MKQKQILALLQDMSLPEKIGQMVQMVGMLYDAKEQGIITGPMMADMKVTEEDLKMAGKSLPESRKAIWKTSRIIFRRCLCMM